MKLIPLNVAKCEDLVTLGGSDTNVPYLFL